MSRREYQRAVEESLREHKPLRVVEPPVKVGNGGKTFKTLTAAVKAAEREKEEARAAAADAWHAACDAVAAMKAAEQEKEKARRVQAQAIALCVFWAALALIALGVQVSFIIF